jgi:hypothetical protein
MFTQTASNNKQLGFWKIRIWFSDFDLSHKRSFNSAKSKPVHGIIGADVLLKGKAIVDYANYFLYLQ